MYQVILCSDAIHGAEHYGRPMAIYRLASHLRQHDYQVKTVNFFTRLSDEQFEQLVDKYVCAETRLFAISATVIRNFETNDFFGISYAQLQQRLALIRSRYPNIKFAVGGGQINNASAEVLQEFKVFDYIMTGQGENALLALVEHLTHKAKLVTSTVQRPRLISDQTYPFADFNQSLNQFTEHDDVLPQEALPLELARGCVFKCKFCSYDLTNKDFFEFTKNEDLLRQEIINNYEQFRTQYYVVVDDLINDSEEKVDMLLRITESLPFPIYISGYIRLDLIWRFPSMADKLRRIGLIACFMGIETINDASGRSVGKGLGRARIQQALDTCHTAWQGQVFVQGNFILGLPKDNTQTADDLVAWGTGMMATGRLHKILVGPMSVNPWLGKAEIDKEPEKFGYSIVSSSNTQNKRFVGDEVQWQTDQYCSEQAVADANRCTAEFLNIEPFPNIQTFNLPFIVSISNGQFKNILFKSLTAPRNSAHHHLIDKIADESYKKYQQQYLAKLLS
jgi:hypothetical protein